VQCNTISTAQVSDQCARTRMHIHEKEGTTAEG